MGVVGEFGAARREADPNREPDQIRFYGELFAIADRVGLAPLADFAEAASAGVDSDTMEGLVAVKDMLRDCLAEGEFDRFWRCVKANRVNGEELVEVCGAVYAVIAARPTESPSDSSDGRSTTSPSSSPSSTRRAALGLVPVEQAMGLTG